VSGGISGRIDTWAVGRRGQLFDIGAFGDGGQSFFEEGPRAYSVSVSGHATPNTNIVTSGTTFVTLKQTGSARYQGVVRIQNAEHQSSYRGGRVLFRFNGWFDGDPTVS